MDITTLKIFEISLLRKRTLLMQEGSFDRNQCLADVNFCLLSKMVCGVEARYVTKKEVEL